MIKIIVNGELEEWPSMADAMARVKRLLFWRRFDRHVMAFFDEQDLPLPRIRRNPRIKSQRALKP